MNTLPVIPEDIADRLAEPFEASEVKFKPQSVKGNRALATVYIDARLVMDRLDEVFGVAGWQDEYTPLDNGSVMCRLSVRIGDVWVVKADVGSESEQPDGGDRLKAAFSDALKRAAVKLGVGRYLYRVGPCWHDYDPVKKKFVSRPPLPNWALPKPQTVTRRLPDAAPYAEPIPLTPADDEPKALPAPSPTKAKKEKAPPPATLAELYAAINKADPPADGKTLELYLSGTAAHLLRLADYQPDELYAAVKEFLKQKPDVPIPFAALTAAQLQSGWNFVKQTVKRFADAATANPKTQQAS